MQPAQPRGAVTAIRAALLTFTGDPFLEGAEATRRYESDAIVAMADGRIVDCGANRGDRPSRLRRLHGGGYWRAVRTLSDIVAPAFVRNGLMSSPPRRVKRASTVNCSQWQRALTSTKMRSTQCSWNPAWQR